MKRIFIGLLILSATLLAQAVPVHAAGSLSGIVWHDLNFDGVRQQDEFAVRNYALTLRATDGSSTWVQTDQNGVYTFTGVVPGEYTIEAYAAVQTYPERTLNEIISIPVTVPDGALSGINIGVSNSVPRVTGTVWRNAAETPRSEVLAYVGGTLCGSKPAGNVIPTDTGPSFFMLSFAPPGFIPGCDEGATVRFTVNGQTAPQTIPYPPVVPAGISSPAAPMTEMPVSIDLIFGPAFARYLSEVPLFSSTEHLHPEGELRAVINGVDCGIRLFAFGPLYISVLPASLKAGCGVEGSVVEFYFGDVKAEQTAAWTPGLHQIEITLPASALVPLGTPQEEQTPQEAASPAIAPPTVGTGGLR